MKHKIVANNKLTGTTYIKIRTAPAGMYRVYTEESAGGNLALPENIEILDEKALDDPRPHPLAKVKKPGRPVQNKELTIAELEALIAFIEWQLSQDMEVMEDNYYATSRAGESILRTIVKKLRTI